MRLTDWIAVREAGRVRLLTGWATVALLLCSVALNVVLSRRLMAFADPQDASSLVGTIAPVIEAKNLRGDATEIRFGERPTILYYFSPKCGWCDRNWTNVHAMVAGVGGRYRVIGLSSIPDVSEFVTAHHLGFEVYSGLSLESARLYRFSGTPQTVVVGSDGRIQHVWPGAFRSQLQQEVERELGVVLPGLTTPNVH